MISVRFEVTNTGPFPYVGQTSFEDPIHYITLALDSEYKNHNSPSGWSVITGMGWNPLTKTIWCSNGTTTANQVVAFDPLTELETNALTLAPTQPVFEPQGSGTKGFCSPARSMAGSRCAI